MKKYIRIWVTLKRVTRLIRISVWSLNNWDREEWRKLRDFWAELDWNFWLEFSKAVQRRGVHVNTPKNGSRVGEFCFGGILGFYAELRREIIWGKLNSLFFGVLFEVPRRAIEEGGPMCAFGGIYCVPIGEMGPL
jgi:hypothetical protein